MRAKAGKLTNSVMVNYKDPKKKLIRKKGG